MYYKTRSQFSPSDYNFIAQIFGRTESERNAILSVTDDPVIITHLLRREELFRSLSGNCSTFVTVSPSLYFYSMIYQALNFKHIADDDLADYVSGICVDFTTNESLWRYSTDVSERMLYFVDLTQVLSDFNEVQQYHMHQFIGNAALFLTGFFPDVIYRREKRKGSPSLDYYESVGYSHFDAAANASQYYESDATPVLHKLVDYFSDVRSAINLYVDTYLNLHNPNQLVQRIERQSATLDDESFRQSLLL